MIWFIYIFLLLLFTPGLPTHIHTRVAITHSEMETQFKHAFIFVHLYLQSLFTCFDTMRPGIDLLSCATCCCIVVLHHTKLTCNS